MTSNLIEQVNALDDFHAVKFLQHFSQMLLDGVVGDVEQLLTGIPSSVRAMPEYACIESLFLGETEAKLTDAESITISRKFLELLAQEPTFSPLLEKAWDTYENKQMGAAKTVLSAGLAASMVIFVATSEATFQVGNFTFNKTGASPELIKAVTEPVMQLIKTVPSSRSK